MNVCGPCTCAECRIAQLFTSLRVAVTGRTVSPPLFETMETLGRDTSMQRIAQAIEALAAHAG